MNDFYWTWAVSFAVLLLFTLWLGRYTSPRRVLGILIDGRGRYSLTHLQIVVWSVVILSLISGIFFGRLIDHVPDPLGFDIPSQVLGLLGISTGSALTAGAIKSAKDVTNPESISASSAQANPARFAQVFLREEGTFADKVIDVTKYQNFIFTVILVVAYVVLALHQIHDATKAESVVVPTFSGTFLILLGISHAAYLGGKLPPPAGTPSTGLTVAELQTGNPPPASGGATG